MKTFNMFPYLPFVKAIKNLFQNNPIHLTLSGPLKPMKTFLNLSKLSQPIPTYSDLSQMRILKEIQIEYLMLRVMHLIVSYTSSLSFLLHLLFSQTGLFLGL